MSTSRSYGDKQVGQQLYRVIEFCSNRETLWHKIRSGQYDWLGGLAYLTAVPHSSVYAFNLDGTVAAEEFVVRIEPNVV